MIWVASAELAPKLNVTFTPGWAASNCLPSGVNVPVSDDAANTVIDPDSDGDADAELLALGDADELPELLLERSRPRRRDDATSPAATRVTAIRRTVNS